MTDEGSPVALADAHASVRRFHVAPDVKERTAGRRAQEIDDQLSLAAHAILSPMLPEPPERGVRGEPRQKVVHHGCDRVVSAEAPIKRVWHAILPDVATDDGIEEYAFWRPRRGARVSSLAQPYEPGSREAASHAC